VIACPKCGQENPAGARFCNACSAPLEEEAVAGREERKVVTVLFADLVGFTARAEQLDPEDVRGLLGPYHAHLRGELERFGGTVEKFIGDAVVALFGAPTSHEDDPERAMRAGMASGDVINTAARLQSAAPVNGILVGETTYRATKDVIEYREAEPVEAKGKAQPVPVWEALEARSRYGVDLVEAQAPLVGREHELHILGDALRRARSRGLLQLVTLVGVPGIGKSRLVHELFRQVEAEPEFTTWRQGRSLPYGEGVSFWALAEIVKAQAGILESDSGEEVERKLREAVEQVAPDPDEAAWMASRLGNLVGTSDDDSVAQGESFSAWRHFVEALAHDRPLVLVFEDLHWADDGLLDFVDQLVDWARESPLLVLCTARPELLERRPGWGGGKANATTISLPPLEDAETAKLFASLLDQAVLPAETQSVLLARAAGNPLYAEQYARMLGERGGGEDLPLPETVQGIIAARLDGLGAPEKALLQDASVVGKVFWLGAMAAIGGVDRALAETALMGLERKELIQRARRSSVEGEAEYAFRHLLVRDVAYGQIPRAARIDKHLATAEWVEALGRTDDRAEMLAHHYSSALDYARASGREDAALEQRARLVLREAGDRAALLFAWPAAAKFYEDALELWPRDDPGRPALRFRLGRARVATSGDGLELMEAAVDELEAAGEIEAAAAAAVVLSREYWGVGDVVRHDACLDRALSMVGDEPDSPARVAAIAGQAARNGFDGRFSEALALTNEGLPAAERLGLDPIRVRLLETRAYVRLTGGDQGGFEDFDTAIRLGTEIRAYDRLHTALNNYMEKLLGLGRLEEALETFEAMKRNQERYVTDNERRWVLYLQGTFDYIVGKWSEAAVSIDAFIAELDAGSAHYLESPVRLIRASMRRAAGDVAGAVEDGDKALERARQVNEAQVLSQAISTRAAIFLEEGRRAEALQLANEALEEGDRFVHTLNDVAIVDAAWVMYDLGLGEVYTPLLEASTDLAWAAAGVAICAGDFRRAADLLAEIGYRPGEAYARLRAAEQLVEEERRAEANSELNAALAFWRSVGAARYVREGEALLAASA
jgi:class 3 adenylate cyclase/tetratricopeptide (TPR) repeat protein